MSVGVAERLADAVEVAGRVDGPHEGRAGCRSCALHCRRVGLVVGDERLLGGGRGRDGVGHGPGGGVLGMPVAPSCTARGAALHAAGVERHDVEAGQRARR